MTYCAHRLYATKLARAFHGGGGEVDMLAIAVGVKFGIVNVKCADCSYCNISSES